MMTRLWPYVLGSVALGLDAYVIAGLLPTIAADIGSSSATVGIGVAAFTGAYAISGPALAGAAGRCARPSLLTALAVFTVGNVATALAPNTVVFIGTRLAAGAAAGVYSPLSSAVAASSVDSERRGRALSCVLAGLACGTVFGVPAGLLVAEHVSWRWTFGIIAALGALAMLGVAARGRDVVDVQAPSFRARLATLSRVPNVLTMLVTLLTGTASLGLYTYFMPLLTGMGLAADHVWLIWVWGVGGALGASFVGRLVDGVDRPGVITLVITVLLATAFLLIGWHPALGVTAAAIFSWGLLGWSSLAPQQHTLMTNNPHDGTTAVAANASANYLGSALGSTAGSVLIGLGVTGSTLAYAAAVPVVLAFLVQLVRIRMPEHLGS